MLRILPSWLLPRKMFTMFMLLKFFEIARYGPEYALKDIPNATKIYHGESLRDFHKQRRTNMVLSANICVKIFNIQRFLKYIHN